MVPGVKRSAGTPALLGEGPHTLEERLRTKSTPLVRKIAAEHNVAVHQLPGTRRNGRVTREDILKVVEQQKAAPAAHQATHGELPRRGVIVRVR